MNPYVEVLRRSPRVELARIAVRRAYRTVRPNRLLRPSATVDEWTDEQLLRAAFDGPAAWCSRTRRDEVLAALSTLHGAEIRALRRARAAAERRFTVFGREVRFGDPIGLDWSLDPGSGRRYPALPAEQISLSTPGMDPKFAWTFGRLDQLVALGQGYWIESREPSRRAFAEQLVAQVTDFLRFNPVGQGIQWASPMEVALRAANLAWALRMFADAPEVREPAFLRRALAALVEHADFVESHREDHWLVPNNHLVANDVGLLVSSALCPDLPGARRRIARAARGLRRQMELQVHPDGVTFEGSTCYQRLCVELFTLGYLAAQQAGVDLGARFRSRLRSMFHVCRDLCSEHGLAPQVGDNDSGRALPLTDRESLDHGYLAALGAALFEDPSLKVPGAELPDEAAWLLGGRGLLAFARLPAEARPRSFSSTASGLHALRGAGAVACISAGPVGQRGVGGHSHNDRLSFELHLDGQPVIVDPGTGTYTRDPAVRNALRGTASHNALQLDGCEHASFDPSRLFSLHAPSTCEVLDFDVGSGVERLVAEHRGCGALPRPTEVERSFVLHAAQRAFTLVDSVRGTDIHRLELRLHLPDDQVRLRRPLLAETARALRACDALIPFGPWAAELGPRGGVRAVVLFAAPLQVEIVPAVYSPGYAELVKSSAVLGGAWLQAPCRLQVVILFGPGEQR